MKRIFTILAAVLLTATVWAQSPEKMSYQAVVRDADDNLVTSSNVGMQISILQGSDTGTPVYVETQTTTTNANGLVTVEIGNGTVVSGDFTTIDWADGPYFIKTETDPTGGSNYTITGTSQLLSVPYALHAKTAETISGIIDETDPVYMGSQAANITATDITNLGNLSGTNTGDQDLSNLATKVNVLELNNTTAFTPDADYEPATKKYVDDNLGHYVGELYGGGIIFWVTPDGQHGLITSLDDLDGGSGVAWSNITDVEIGATAQNYYDGTGNTTAIIGQSGHTSSAAKLCNDYSNDGFTDWYLPSTLELRQMDDAILTIYNVLANDGDGTTNPLNPEYVAPTYGRYWSSTEYNNSNAWTYCFDTGNSYNSIKTPTYRVRAVRAF